MLHDIYYTLANYHANTLILCYNIFWVNLHYFRPSAVLSMQRWILVHAVSRSSSSRLTLSLFCWVESQQLTIKYYIILLLGLVMILLWSLWLSVTAPRPPVNMYAVRINGTSVRIVATVPRYQLSYSEQLTIDKILYNDDPESLGSQDIGEKQFHILHLPPPLSLALC